MTTILKMRCYVEGEFGSRELFTFGAYHLVVCIPMYAPGERGSNPADHYAVGMDEFWRPAEHDDDDEAARVL